MQEKDIVLLYIIVFELFTFLKHTIVFKYFFWTYNLPIEDQLASGAHYW